MPMRLYFARAQLITLAVKLGFELGPVHQLHLPL